MNVETQKVEIQNKYHDVITKILLFFSLSYIESKL